MDDLGGFWTAVAEAKTLTGISPNTRVAFKNYPQSRGFVGTVSRLLDGSAASLKALEGLSALMQAAPVKAMIDVARAIPEGRAELRAIGLPRY